MNTKEGEHKKNNRGKENSIRKRRTQEKVEKKEQEGNETRKKKQ